jgi:hypothetical protein
MVPPARRKKWHLRLFRNLNLLLQILAVALLALAAAGPQLPRPALFGVERGVIIIDHSASMNAVEQGRSRLSRAKAQAAALLDRFRNSATVYVMGSGAEITVSTGSAAGSPETRRRIDSVAPTDTEGSPREALARARDLVGSGDASVVHLVTDGAFELDPAYLRSFPNLSVHQVGGGGENRGITRFAFRESSDGSSELYLEVMDRSSADSTLTVAAGEEVLLERTLSPDEGPQHAISLRLAEPLPEQTSAKLSGGDALAADDRAVMTAGGLRPIRVLLAGQQSVFLESFFRVHPRVTLQTAPALPGDGSAGGPGGRSLPGDGSAGEPGSRSLPGAAAPGGRSGQGAGGEPAEFDLIVANRLPRLPAERGAYLAVATPVAGLPVEQGRVLQGVSEISWNDQHELLADVDLSDLRIYRAAATTVDDPAVPLVQGSAGALAWAYESENLRLVSLQFPIAESNLSLLAGFPVLLDNALSWLLPGGAVDREATHRTGSAIELRAGAVPAVTVRTPDGTRHDVRGQERFHRTERAGVYSVGYEDGSQRPIAVNLLSPEETDIRQRLELPPDGPDTEGERNVVEYDDTVLTTAALVLLLGLLIFDFWLWRRQRA